MGYFDFLPNIAYKNDAGNYVFAKNILTRAKILDIVKEAQSSALDYTIKDEERPETIADRVYGRSDYHWIILLFNEILDPIFDWPLSENEMEKQLENLYAGKSLFVYPPLLWDYKSGIGQDGKIVRFDKRLPHFEVGDTITQKDNTGEVIATATIKSWDPNLYKIEVVDVNGSFAIQPNLQQLGGSAISRPEDISHDLFSTNRNGRIVAAQLIRLTDDSRYALHHFQRSNGEIISPLYKPVTLTDSMRNESPSSLIDRYALGGVELIPLGVDKGNEDLGYAESILNIAYEQSINDKKRTIRVMRPEYIDPLLRDFRRLFQVGIT
jgi:hypothetical protein